MGLHLIEPLASVIRIPRVVPKKKHDLKTVKGLSLGNKGAKLYEKKKKARLKKIEDEVKYKEKIAAD